MEKQEEISKEIQYHAQRCLYYNELLIQQCDSWLSAEEGNKNMIRALEERDRKKRIARRRKFFGIDKIQSVVQKFVRPHPPTTSPQERGVETDNYPSLPNESRKGSLSCGEGGGRGQNGKS